MKDYFVYFSYVRGALLHYGSQILNLDPSTLSEATVKDEIKTLEGVSGNIDIIRFRLIA
jgi:hypothetical protein